MRKPIKITIKMLPGYAVVRTPEELKASGYAVPEGQKEQKNLFFMLGMTQVDPLDPNNITISLSPLVIKWLHLKKWSRCN